MGKHDSNDKCPAPPQPINDTGSAHQIFWWISLVCLGITAIFTFALIIMHMCRYVVPQEQRQIIRLVFTPVVFAACSFATFATDYNTSQYIEALTDLYDSFAVPSIFLLFVQYAQPRGTFGPELFRNLKADAHEKPGAKVAFNPQRVWMLVFQYPIVSIMEVVIQWATLADGKYCAFSWAPKYGAFWVSILRSFTTTMAIIAVVRFYTNMKHTMTTRRPLAKLVCFKLIIFVTSTVQFIMPIIVDKAHINPTSTLSNSDLRFGIPAIISSIMVVPISMAMFWCYTTSDYSSARVGKHQKHNVFYAMINAWDPMDLIKGMLRAFGILAMGQAGGRGGKGSGNGNRGPGGRKLGHQLTHSPTRPIKQHGAPLGRSTSPTAVPPPPYPPPGRENNPRGNLQRTASAKFNAAKAKMQPGNDYRRNENNPFNAPLYEQFSNSSSSKSTKPKEFF